MSGCRAFMGETTAGTAIRRCRGYAKRVRSSGRATSRADSVAEPQGRCECDGGARQGSRMRGQRLVAVGLDQA